MPTPALRADTRRRYERTPLSLRVQYLAAGKGPFEGDLRDISLGGAAIASAVRPRMGETVTAYIDNIARLEGQVVRYFREGFAIQFQMGDRKRERLRQAIQRHVGGAGASPVSEKRQYIRADALQAQCEVETEDGECFECRVKELSIVGASLETERRLRIGAVIKIGPAQARVVRHTPYGFAVEFTDYWRALSIGGDS